MNDFENQLDEIRIKLYEETKELDKTELINKVNSHAEEIANKFGIHIESMVKDSNFQLEYA